MSAGLHLADAAQTDLCLALVAKFHEELGAPYDDAHRRAVIEPLLQGSPLGAVWLIGPARAPLGYVLVTFEWSIEAAGMVGWVREIYTRPNVRKRGIGTETLHAVAVALRGGGVKALHVDLQAAENPQNGFWNKVGFRNPAGMYVLTEVL